MKGSSEYCLYEVSVSNELVLKKSMGLEMFRDMRERAALPLDPCLKLLMRVPFSTLDGLDAFLLGTGFIALNSKEALARVRFDPSFQGNLDFGV